MGFVFGLVLAVIGAVGLFRTAPVVDLFARLWPRDFSDDMEPLASFTMFVRLLSFLLLLAGIALLVTAIF